jgi:thymidylate synthase (FAD)
MAIANSLKWKKYHPLTDQNAFICLVDVMGDDQAIVQAARASYDGFAQGLKISNKVLTKFSSKVGKEKLELKIAALDNRRDTDGYPDVFIVYFEDADKRPIEVFFNSPIYQSLVSLKEMQIAEDRHLTRYLMNHEHTTPFEMVTVKFMVQVPMDCWRQWIRHRTASVNEYSTRYMEALDFFQVTDPSEWRLQSTDNKQGSSGFLTQWPEGWELVRGGEGEDLYDEYYRVNNELDMSFELDFKDQSPGQILSRLEKNTNSYSENTYKTRLALGIAKEQARKDLPLSTYTRAYWQCNLRNIFHFLRLRMDSHAQLEIRSFANSMFEIIKQLCPVACEAFEDYVLHAKKFSRMEMEVLKEAISLLSERYIQLEDFQKPNNMTAREWKEFIAKLS